MGHLLLAVPTILIGILMASNAGSGRAEPRLAAIARAQVWRPTDVARMDIRTGPDGPGAFPYLATVQCDYADKELGGGSPKFACRVPPDDEVKVKFGGANGEVYAEVAATRLLWALGFGADRMYPVRIVCRGCPKQLAGIARRDGETYLFDPAVIERKMEGAEFPGKEGWAWRELDLVDEQAGGAPRAHRDALKLLAVMIQHTDSKPEQQRLACLGEDGKRKSEITCERPFMLLHDVGVTFGRASRSNANRTSSMNLAAWSRTPVWKPGTDACIGNLPKSNTGTLENPVVSEEGRRFLADLLLQLTNRQLYDLFTVSRVTLRVRSAEDVRSGFPTVDEWVRAFKDKRDQIVNRRCER
ncbi:MAG TPA: hypothetical protein VNI78_02060 [Vicinamibacterales bacterium]|nr:hypothetical protein [Vicinamibacterales bacterium]